MASGETAERAATAEVELDRDVFLRSLVRELAGSLESVVGLDEAEGFVSIVGLRIGEWIEQQYSRELGAGWTQQQLGEVLVDLKRRIEGDFYIVSVSEDEVVLGNRRCPFGDKVSDRPSLCMMTSNVFGHIAASHFDYARVSLDQTIARGDPGCLVTIRLDEPDSALGTEQREYFGRPRPRADE